MTSVMQSQELESIKQWKQKVETRKAQQQKIAWPDESVTDISVEDMGGNQVARYRESLARSGYAASEIKPGKP